MLTVISDSWFRKSHIGITSVCGANDVASTTLAAAYLAAMVYTMTGIGWMYTSLLFATPSSSEIHYHFLSHAPYKLALFRAINTLQKTTTYFLVYAIQKNFFLRYFTLIKKQLCRACISLHDYMRKINCIMFLVLTLFMGMEFSQKYLGYSNSPHPLPRPESRHSWFDWFETDALSWIHSDHRRITIPNFVYSHRWIRHDTLCI